MKIWRCLTAFPGWYMQLSLTRCSSNKVVLLYSLYPIYVSVFKLGEIWMTSRWHDYIHTESLCLIAHVNAMYCMMGNVPCEE